LADAFGRTSRLQANAVRLDVFAPGSDTPHRQYSQNIACPGGKGRAIVPLALNDTTGEWRLQFRDAATGKAAEKAAVVSLR
jgi:hypothetical protein